MYSIGFGYGHGGMVEYRGLGATFTCLVVWYWGGGGWCGTYICRVVWY